MSNKYITYKNKNSYQPKKKDTQADVKIKKKKIQKAAAMMATLNRLFVWSWQHYTNKQSKPLFLYLWCENKQTTNKASGSYSLKCTSWTFKVAKQNSFLQKKKT